MHHYTCMQHGTSINMHLCAETQRRACGQRRLLFARAHHHPPSPSQSPSSPSPSLMCVSLHHYTSMHHYTCMQHGTSIIMHLCAEIQREACGQRGCCSHRPITSPITITTRPGVRGTLPTLAVTGLSTASEGADNARPQVPPLRMHASRVRPRRKHRRPHPPADASSRRHCTIPRRNAQAQKTPT